MRLFEHPDFEQAVLEAAEHFRERGLRPAIIEKDYYVIEVLRIIAGTVGDKTIFKGGTSLSKGWNLIGRFSEDIDIFLDPMSFDPPLGPIRLCAAFRWPGRSRGTRARGSRNRQRPGTDRDGRAALVSRRVPR